MLAMVNEKENIDPSLVFLLSRTPNLRVLELQCRISHHRTVTDIYNLQAEGILSEHNLNQSLCAIHVPYIQHTLTTGI